MTGEHAVENKNVTKLPAQRLCNEIQLFDLCERDTCSHKEGRFCSNADLLEAFEKIADAEEVRSSEMYVTEGLEDGEECDDEEYGESFEDDEIGDEGEHDDY